MFTGILMENSLMSFTCILFKVYSAHTVLQEKGFMKYISWRYLRRSLRTWPRTKPQQSRPSIKILSVKTLLGTNNNGYSTYRFIVSLACQTQLKAKLPDTTMTFYLRLQLHEEHPSRLQVITLQVITYSRQTYFMCAKQN